MYAVSISGNLWPDSEKATRKDHFSTETGIVRSIACALGATPEKKNAILMESLPLFYSYQPLADDAARATSPGKFIFS